MKKTVVIIIAILFFQQVRAQDHIYVTGGVCLSNLFGANYGAKKMEQSSRPGLVAGVQAEWKLTKSLALEPGILYTQRNLKSTPLPYSTASIQQYEFIEVPVLLKVMLDPTFHLLAGPQASYRLSMKSELITTSVYGGWPAVDYHKDGAKLYFGLLAGVSYSPLKNWGVSIKYLADFQTQQLSSPTLGGRFGEFKFAIAYQVK